MAPPTRVPSSTHPGASQIHASSKASDAAGYHSKATRHFLPIPNLVNVNTGHPWADASVGMPEANVVSDLQRPRGITSHLPDIRLKPAKLLKLRAKDNPRPTRDRGTVKERPLRTRRAKGTRRASPLILSGIDAKELVDWGSTLVRTLSSPVQRYRTRRVALQGNAEPPSGSGTGGGSVKLGPDTSVSKRWSFFASQSRRRISATLATALGLWVFWVPITTAGFATLNGAAARIEPRAAFQVVDYFESGVVGKWDPQGLVEHQSGVARVAGLAIHRDTMDLDGYRWDFDAKITSRAVGWVVRASDAENSHVCKLVQQRRRRSEDGYRLIRYPVVNGEAKTSESVERDVEVEWKEDSFNRISVRVGDRQIKTFINGWSVDNWIVPDLQPGGIGFLANRGEASLIRYVAVDSNSDFWGLTLYGALKTVRALEGLLS